MNKGTGDISKGTRDGRFIFALAMLVLVCLSGCTMYHIKKPDGTEVSINSTRSFPNGITVDYQSPQGASLKIQAGSVTQPDPLATVGAQVINALIGKALGGQAPAAPTPAPNDVAGGGK